MNAPWRAATTAKNSQRRMLGQSKSVFTFSLQFSGQWPSRTTQKKARRWLRYCDYALFDCCAWSQRLAKLIRAMLLAMSAAFTAECKCKFRMYKYHTILHVPKQLRELG